jgi:alanyl aminopeptidase
VGADLGVAAALGHAGGKDVSGMLGTFLDQPGIPLVTVEAVDGATVRLSQKRFLNYGVSAPAATWRIPVGLKYRVGGRTQTRLVLMTGPAETVALEGPPAWVHPDLDARGYYRWTVPVAALRALADGGDRVMTVRERVGFLGNAAALLDAGLIGGGEYLRLLQPFAGDEEPEVVAEVLAALGKVKRAFVTPEVEAPFAAYVRGLLGPVLERFGRERKPGEMEAVSLLRPQLLLWLGRDGGDPAVRAYADTVARAYLVDPAAGDPSVIGVALQLLALNGDRALFDEYRKRVETSRVPIDRQRFLAALGYFRRPELTEEALRFALDPALRPQELFAIPGGVGTSVRNEERPYRFYRDNFAVIQGRIPPMFLAFMPQTAGGCSEARVAEARAFFADPARSAPGMEKEMAKVAESVKDCAALRAREGASVAAYLSGAR